MYICILIVNDRTTLFNNLTAFILMPECWKEMDLKMGRGKRTKGMNYEEHKRKRIQNIGYRRSTWQKS